MKVIMIEFVVASYLDVQQQLNGNHWLVVLLSYAPFFIRTLVYKNTFFLYKNICFTNIEAEVDLNDKNFEAHTNFFL